MPSSNADWPIQPRPHNTVWSLWQKALSKSVCHNPNRYILSNRPSTLKERLGAWYPDSAPQSSPRWATFFSHSSQRLFVLVPTQPERLRQISTPTTRLDFSLTNFDLRETPTIIAATALPSDAVPRSFQPTTSEHFLRVNSVRLISMILSSKIALRIASTMQPTSGRLLLTQQCSDGGASNTISVGALPSLI
jgi:hypothetical protein